MVILTNYSIGTLQPTNISCLVENKVVVQRASDPRHVVLASSPHPKLTVSHLGNTSLIEWDGENWKVYCSTAGLLSVSVCELWSK